MARITIVGCGEAFDPERANTSLIYEGSQILLLDCGYSVPHAFWKITQDPSYLDAIYLSHIHADHTFGLPALLLWMRIEGRTRPLTVFGGPGIESWLEKLLQLGYPGSYTPDRCFPIHPVEVSPDESVAFGACTLSVAQSEHSVRNLAVRITENGRSMAYSGDGISTPATRSLFRGVQLLLHESYWLQGTEHGHSGAKELVPMAIEADVETLALIHIGKNEQEAVRQFASEPTKHLRIITPNPGDVIDV